MDTKSRFQEPEYFENRELSWIKFDQRVLNEARDKSRSEREKCPLKNCIASAYSKSTAVTTSIRRRMVRFAKSLIPSPSIYIPYL